MTIYCCCSRSSLPRESRDCTEVCTKSRKTHTPRSISLSDLHLLQLILGSGPRDNAQNRDHTFLGDRSWAPSIKLSPKIGLGLELALLRIFLPRLI